jgi:hypothetical protein
MNQYRHKISNLYFQCGCRNADTHDGAQEIHSGNRFPFSGSVFISAVKRTALDGCWYLDMRDVEKRRPVDT